MTTAAHASAHTDIATGPRQAGRRTAVARHLAFVTPLLLAVVGWAAALAPLSAQAATETRNVPEFQAINLSAGIDVTVRQGASQSLTLDAEDSVLQVLESVVENGSNGPTLVLRYKRGNSVFTSAKVRATVVVPRLSAVSVAGSGDVRIEAFQTPALKLSVSGSGDIVAQGLTTEELNVGVAGSGDVRGSGSARRLKVSVAGSGDVRLLDLRSEDAVVAIAGSGDVAVQAQATLNVNIVGSGDVQYTGAAKLKKSITGSGNVQQR